MKLLKGFRFSLTIILLIAVITACAAPSAQPTVEPIEGPTATAKASLKVGDVLLTPLEKNTYHTDEAHRALLVDFSNGGDFLKDVQKLQLLQLPERTEKSFKSLVLDASEKNMINMLGNRLITTLYTLGYASEEAMRQNLELAMQETYAPELLAVTQKNDFAKHWVARLYNGQVATKLSDFHDSWGNNVELLNEDGTLVATELFISLSYEGTNGTNMPSFFETGNEALEWHDYNYNYYSHVGYVFRIICKKSENGWMINDWSYSISGSVSPARLNHLTINAEGAKAFQFKTTPFMEVPQAVLITSKKEISNTFYSESEHKIKDEFHIPLQQIETLSLNLAALFEGNYSSFSADHFSLYEKTASPELAKVLNETGFFNKLMQKGNETGLIMEYSPSYGTRYRQGPAPSLDPLAHYKNGFLFARRVNVILRKNASSDFSKSFGLPADNVSLWSQEFYFSVINGKVALEGLRFYEVSNLDYLTQDELWTYEANG